MTAQSFTRSRGASPSGIKFAHMENQFKWTIEDELNWQLFQCDDLRRKTEHQGAILLATLEFLLKYKERFTKSELNPLWLKIMDIEGDQEPSTID